MIPNAPDSFGFILVFWLFISREAPDIALLGTNRHPHMTSPFLVVATIVAVAASLVSAQQMHRAAPHATSCQQHPWPYADNVLRRGESLPVGSVLRSTSAVLAITEQGMSLFRAEATDRAIWNITLDGSAPRVERLHLSTKGFLSLQGTNDTVLWSVPPSTLGDVLVLTDHCWLSLFEKAPMTHSVWNATPMPLCVRAHIVPHSHDDVGWLLTPERYYDGCFSQNDGGVQGIYSSVVASLAAAPWRTFIAVEIYFFQRWWTRQNHTVRNLTRRLVSSRQLVFINAGHSMHDEACVHQESAVSNMQVGSQFLRSTFGVDWPSVNVGWHIDPFGHASATPRLMAQMGFDSFWFWRPGDVQQHEHQLRHRLMETIWLPSASLGSRVAMFTSILYDSYCSGCGMCHGQNTCPGGFCCYDCEQHEEAPSRQRPVASTGGRHAIFQAMAARERERLPRRTQPLQFVAAMMSRLSGRNNPFEPARWPASCHHLPPCPTLESLAQCYADGVRQYAAYFRTQHVLVPWGCDFAHNYAIEDYDLMDLIMFTVNLDPVTYGVHLEYSTPDRYVENVHYLNYSWPSNVDDYFIYADYAHSYWSGYFSSRAQYKGFERMLMNQRGAAEILATQVDPKAFRNLTAALSAIQQFQEIMGVAQHHDSITGTERQHVRNRYQYLLTQAWTQTEQHVVTQVFHSAGVATGNVSRCPLANLSDCRVTNEVTTGAHNYSVVLLVTNPLMMQRQEIVRVPVPVPIGAVDELGAMLPVQLDPTWAYHTTHDPLSPPLDAPQPLLASILVSIAPLATMRITLSSRGVVGPVSPPHPLPDNGTVLQNERYAIRFTATGEVAAVRNELTGVETGLYEHPARFTPMPSGRGQAAGAYIFRPNVSNATAVPFRIAHAVLIRGPLCSEVRRSYYPETDRRDQMIQSFWRVCQGDGYVDLGLGAGALDPLPGGIELVHVVGSPDIASNGTWWTDSEALEIETRRRNQRPNYPYEVTEPVASNFFPSNQFAAVFAAIAARGATSHARRGEDSIRTAAAVPPSIVVVADRSRAAASLLDGELQFLVLRRLLFDDNRGVAQPLDENSRLLTESRLSFHGHDVISDLRLGGQRHAHPLILHFESVDGSAAESSRSTMIPSATMNLPPELHLHSRMFLSNHSLLVRLQHMFSTDDGHGHGRGIEVDLRQVLPAWLTAARLESIVEYDLNGVVRADAIERLNWRVCPEDDRARRRALEGGGTSFTDGSILVGELYTADRPPLAWHRRDVGKEPVMVMHAMDLRTFVVTFS